MCARSCSAKQMATTAMDVKNESLRERVAPTMSMHMTAVPMYTPAVSVGSSEMRYRNTSAWAMELEAVRLRRSDTAPMMPTGVVTIWHNTLTGF